MVPGGWDWLSFGDRIGTASTCGSPECDLHFKSWSRLIAHRQCRRRPRSSNGSGEQGLLLPALVARALAANDRLEYYLTLLQTAQAYATAPSEPAPSLRLAREASGVTDSSLDRIVEGSSTIGSNTLHIPNVESIVEQLFDELRLMLPPLEVAGRTHPDVQCAGRYVPAAIGRPRRACAVVS